MSILDNLTLDSLGSLTQPTVDDYTLDDLATDNTPAEPITLVDLDGETDPRLKLLSHSSRTTLHKCPRKYQLYRLSSSTIPTDAVKERESAVTFAYGHAVGTGIQSAIEGKSYDEVLLDTFLSWDTDLLDETPRQKKSFWLAVFAVQRFIEIRNNDYLADYELVYYKGKPAVELSFLIDMPDGAAYRGYVDVVLQHVDTKEVMVLELKTSSGTANPAMYKNSGQAVGYSVVLDIMFPEVSSYTVLYLVYETKSMQYKELPFNKTLLQRALWLQELLIDCQAVELYESYSIYPTHGESCFDFFRECEYMGLCHLDTANITKPFNTKMQADLAADRESYQFKVSFLDLVEQQISKGE